MGDASPVSVPEIEFVAYNRNGSDTGYGQIIDAKTRRLIAVSIHRDDAEWIIGALGAGRRADSTRGDS